MRLCRMLLLLFVAVSVSAQGAPAIAPRLSASPSPCVDTAPDCEAVCDEMPGNVQQACSLQTPIGSYLR